MIEYNDCVTVYCASATAIDKRFFNDAREVARLLSEENVPVITGAGKMGLMGAVNDEVIATGGVTVGVIPQFMVDKEWHHTGLSHLEITPDMHTRKELMAKYAQGVIALPGGCGTFEELLEIITWRQLGLYHGNIVILNTMGYYDNLLAMLDNAIECHFMPKDHRKLWAVAKTPSEAVTLTLEKSGEISLSPKF